VPPPGPSPARELALGRARRRRAVPRAVPKTVTWLLLRRFLLPLVGDQARPHVRRFFGFFPASTGAMAGFPIRSGSTPDRAIPSFRVTVSFFDLVLLFFLIQKRWIHSVSSQFCIGLPDLGFFVHIPWLRYHCWFSQFIDSLDRVRIRCRKWSKLIHSKCVRPKTTTTANTRESKNETTEIANHQ
jgi:hypothetical protein